jgi:hypothetical protein
MTLDSATVQIERGLALDLIYSRLRRVRGEIDHILCRWHETAPSAFLEKARSGEYEEAENDAIDLRQLLLEEQKLMSLLDRIGEEGANG